MLSQQKVAAEVKNNPEPFMDFGTTGQFRATWDTTTEYVADLVRFSLWSRHYLFVGWLPLVGDLLVDAPMASRITPSPSATAARRRWSRNIGLPILAFNPLIGHPSGSRPVAITTELYVIGYPVGYCRWKKTCHLGFGCVGQSHGLLGWTGTACLPPSSIAGPDRAVWVTGGLLRRRADTIPGPDGQLHSGPVWEVVGIYSGRTHDDSDVGIVWKRSAIEAR